MAKSPLKGIRYFLIGVGVFFFITVVVVVYLSFQQGQKNQQTQQDVEELSIEEVRSQARRR